MDFILNIGLRLAAAHGLPSAVEFSELASFWEHLSQLAFFLLLFSAPGRELDLSIRSSPGSGTCVLFLGLDDDDRPSLVCDQTKGGRAGPTWAAVPWSSEAAGGWWWEEHRAKTLRTPRPCSWLCLNEFKAGFLHLQQQQHPHQSSWSPRSRKRKWMLSALLRAGQSPR